MHATQWPTNMKLASWVINRQAPHKNATKKKQVKKRKKRIYFLPVLPWAPDSLTVGELARAHPFPGFSTNSSLGDSSSFTVSFPPSIFSSSPQRIFRIRFSSEKKGKREKAFFSMAAATTTKLSQTSSFLLVFSALLHLLYSASKSESPPPFDMA